MKFLSVKSGGTHSNHWALKVNKTVSKVETQHFCLAAGILISYRENPWVLFQSVDRLSRRMLVVFMSFQKNAIILSLEAVQEVTPRRNQQKRLQAGA